MVAVWGVDSGSCLVAAFNSLVVMAVDSMLRRADRAQAGIQRLHDQALVGAERSRVGIRLGPPAFSKPDDDTGTSRGEMPFQTQKTFPSVLVFVLELHPFWRDRK